MVKGVIILVLGSITSMSFSQNHNRVDSLKRLGREALIQLAIKHLNDPLFKPHPYDRTEVKASQSSVIVEFRMSIRVSDKHPCYYSAIDVALEGDGDAMSFQGDCKEPEYYQFPDAHKKIIAFVFDAINKSDEIGHIPGNILDPDTTMEIAVLPGHYYVEVSSWSTYSHYNVNSITGAITEAGHKHYDRRGEKEDEEFEIIK